MTSSSETHANSLQNAPLQPSSSTQYLGTFAGKNTPSEMSAGSTISQQNLIHDPFRSDDFDERSNMLRSTSPKIDQDRSFSPPLTLTSQNSQLISYNNKVAHTPGLYNKEQSGAHQIAPQPRRQSRMMSGPSDTRTNFPVQLGLPPGAGRPGQLPPGAARPQSQQQRFAM